ncbi:hypothetical protein HF521_015947 [Silurus meridionalis]|uniref:CCHC-type domain-containing protein n=1 Tax=Silurus meridionalis TaxID=175797 RepID=A0A8T0BUB6_SILME|nr:hypothetical protein HF521_015947 [Silurus meridionalis]
MGSAWDETTANITLFRIMVKRVLPSKVQEKLESVVGLNALPWASFQAHVTHAVEMYRKKKEANKQAAEDLITWLHKAQLREITRRKQENQEKRKEEKSSAKQAAVMMVPTNAQLDPTGQTMPDQGNQQLMPVGQPMMVYPTNQQYPPQNSGWGQGRGKGRGGMFQPRPRNYQPPRGGRCWNCQDPNHMMRNCPYPIRQQQAMMLPKALAIVKCKAHKSDGEMVSRGNAAADEAAKSAAVDEDCVKVMVQDEEHEEVRGQVTEEDLGEYQDVASWEEKERWKK